MANKKLKPEEKKEDRIVVKCSEKDYEAHGGKKALTRKFHDLRDSKKTK